MTLGQDLSLGNFPGIIDVLVEEYSSSRFPLTESEKRQANTKTMLILKKEVEEFKGVVPLKNTNAFLLQRMIPVLNIRKKGLGVYFEWGMTFLEEAIPNYVRNITTIHGTAIEEHSTQYPETLSGQDKQLLSLFMNNPSANSRQFVTIAGMKDLSQLNEECYSFINSCFKIFKNNRFKH